MTDFAARIISHVTSASTKDRAAFARQCVNEFDRNADGSVSATEFQHVFAALRRTDELTGGSTTSFVASGCRPTLFECTLYPSWSNAYAASAYQAMAMLDRFDQDGDSNVTLDEFSADPVIDPSPETTDPTETPATDPTTPVDPAPTPDPVEAAPTPAERADALLTAYDITSKGYITIDDIVSKWLADPSLGDIANAGNAIEAWDTDGNGQVSRADIIAAYEIMDAADTVLTVFGGTATASLDLSKLDSAQLSALDLTTEQINAWDTDKSGTVSRNELIDGLKLLRLQSAKDAEQQAFAKIFARLDANQDGMIDSREFASTMTDLALDPATMNATFTAWDRDDSQGISVDELQAGYNAVKDAQAIVASYDIAGKGYFDQADLQRVIDTNGTMDGQASAAEILAAWDQDGDGKVSVQDVIAMRSMMAAATTSNTDPLPQA